MQCPQLSLFTLENQCYFFFLEKLVMPRLQYIVLKLIENAGYMFEEKTEGLGIASLNH